MKFFFDYIYYRMTKFYFKGDGNSGGTAIIGICMIQLLVLIDFILILSRIFFARSEIRNYIGITKWIIAAIFILLFFYNSRKHNRNYDKYKKYWESETRKQKIFKGILVIFSLLFPWIIIIVIGVYWK